MDIIQIPQTPGAGLGDVVGPASSTDNAIVRYDTTTGRLLQNSNVTIADSTGAIAGASSLTSPASTNLTLGTGTYGTALTVASATGAVTATTTLADQGGAIAAQRNGLAPRQGLNFDGSSGAGVQEVNGGRAFGTSDFTLSILVLFKSLPAAGTKIISGADNGAGLYITNASGRLYLVKNGISLDNDSLTNLTTGIWYHIVCARTAGNVVFYINGIQTSSSANAVTYTGATYVLGYAPGAPADPDNMIGSVSGYYPYNRALSAAEVLALYQSGAVASADYNTASNTALNTSTIANYAPSPYAVFTGASASGFVASATTYSYAYSAPVFSVIKGTRYRVNITLSSVSGQLPSVLLGQLGVVDLSSITALVSGVNTIELTATATNANAVVIFTNSAVAAFTASSITVTRLGALLAPDSNNAGAGLQWLDVSGNRAHIILPTSGVTWSLPSSQQIVIEASTATNGNQQLGGASLIDANKQWRIQSWTVNCSTGTPTISLGNVSAGTQYNAAAVLAAGNNDITLVTRFPSTANLWVNSSTTATLIHRITLVPAN